MGDSEAVVPVTWQAMPGLEGAVGPCRSRCPWLRWSVMSTSPARKPFWSTSKRYRFDDPQGKFGVLYAGDSIETSFAESVIHERAVFQKGAYVVELSRLPWPVWYDNAKTELTFADLSDAHMKALGMNNASQRATLTLSDCRGRLTRRAPVATAFVS